MDRSHRASLLGWGIILSLPVAPSASQTVVQRAGNVLFSVPAGWTEHEQGGAPILNPSDLAPGEVYQVRLHPGVELSGDFRTWFTQTWSRIAAGHHVVDGGQIQASRHQLGLDRLMVVALFSDPNGKTAVFWYAVNARGRAEGVSSVSSSTDVYHRYANVLQDLLNGLHYANVEPGYAASHPATPAAPPAVQAPEPPQALPSTVPTPHHPSGPLPPGALDGAYVGLRGAVYETRLEHDFLVFYPDGTVTRHFPEEGLDGFDVTAWRRSEQDNSLVGRYRARGDQIDIIWDDSPDDRWSIRRDEHAADIHGVHVYIPLCRCNGVRLAGTYVWGSNTLQFFPDGTFADNGVVEALLSINVEHPRFGRGTYTLQNNSVTLTYSDGRRIKRSFAAPAVQERSQHFDWIVIDQITLYRQGYRPAP